MRLDGLRFIFPETPAPYPQKIASPSVRGNPLIDIIFFQERVRASIPSRRFLTEGPNQRNIGTVPSEWARMGPEGATWRLGSPAGDSKQESLTTARPSAGAPTVGPSLTPPTRQTTLVPPVRPSPARPARRPRYAVSLVREAASSPYGILPTKAVALSSLTPAGCSPSPRPRTGAYGRPDHGLKKSRRLA